MDIPKGQIEFIVNRYHVGTPDFEIRANIDERVKNHAGWTKAKIAEAKDYAIKVHRGNQAMYRDVMGGHI